MKVLIALCIAASVVCLANGQAENDISCSDKPGDWDHVANCNTCKNKAVRCVDCNPGWCMASDERSCLSCPNFCTSCVPDKNDKSTECLNCTAGYYLQAAKCKECPVSKCIDCEPNKDECNACAPGYVLQEKPKKKFTCEKCPEPCNSCSLTEVSGVNKTTCDSCPAAMYRVATNAAEPSVFTCSGCPSKCATCSFINGEAICNKCFDKYTLDVSTPPKCKACRANCDQCKWNDVTKETDCEAGKCVSTAFKVNNAGVCQSCDAHCQQCDSTTTCSKCNDNYYLSGVTCSQCDTFCKTCTASECQACFAGYALNKNPSVDVTCDLCPSFCNTCDQGGCTSNGCFSRYTRDTNGKCKKCEAGCLACDLSDVCSQCDNEHAAYNSGDCMPCPTVGCNGGCVYDTALKKAKCTQCATGYVRNTVTGDCHPCPDNCDVTPLASKCHYNDTLFSGIVTYCEVGGCLSGYEDKDGLCVACPPRCTTCTWNAGLSVMDCATGNCASNTKETLNAAASDVVDNLPISVGQDYCKPCVEGCLACSTAYDNCDTCDTPTYIDFTGDNLCYKCPTNCASGCGRNVTGTMEMNCGTCVSGYVLNEPKTVCDACPDKLHTGCATCHLDLTPTPSLYVCDSCDGRYYYDTTTKSCSACDPNCKTCTISGGGLCNSNQCDAGYKYNSADKKCYKCGQFCTACDYSGTPEVGQLPDVCTGCQSRYAVNAEQACEQCPDNCHDCTLVGDTIECDTNKCFTYFTRTAEGLCSACPENCGTCTWNTDQGYATCLSCRNTFFTNNKVCSVCPPNCEACGITKGANLCTTCKQGYYVENGFCKTCLSNCEECTGKDQCSRCRVGYGKSGDGKSCKGCADVTAVSSCSLCNDQEGEDPATCLACSSGFVLADNAKACHDESFAKNCRSRWDPPPMCTECASGYSISRHGLCGTNCSVCGTPDNPRPEDECNADGLNYTVTECIGHDTCMMFWYKDTSNKDNKPLVARGCFANYTCTEEELENQEEDRKDKRGPCNTNKNTNLKQCNKCCQGENCNGYKYNGQATLQTSVALLLAAFAAFFVIRSSN